MATTTKRKSAARMGWLEAMDADRESGGESVTAWTYSPRDGQHISTGTALFSGIGPVGAVHVARELAVGDRHVVIRNGERPWHHHVAGCGIGHDDAEFAESGHSMAAYYESGEAWRGPWWEMSASELGRHFGILTTDERRHMAICDVPACAYCHELGERVQQLQCAPVESCHVCGRGGRDLSSLGDGSFMCGSCRIDEMFARE